MKQYDLDFKFCDDPVDRKEVDKAINQCFEKIEQLNEEINALRKANTVWYDQYCGALNRSNTALSFLLTGDVDTAVEILRERNYAK